MALRARVGLSALILGATGATGKALLQELLASPSFTSVSEYGRHVTEQEKLAVGKEKLQQKVIDFERLEDAGLKDGKWDVVFITSVPTFSDHESKSSHLELFFAFLQPRDDTQNSRQRGGV